LTVPAATGGADFSVCRPNMRHGGKKLTDTTENILERLGIDKLGDLGWGQSAVEAKEVCGETSNVRSGHGSSRDHVGLPVVPSGNDVQAGSPDVNGSTKVGERGPDVLDSGSADGNRLLNASGRVLARVIVTVPGGYDDRNAAVIKLKTESFVSGDALTFHPVNAYRYDSSVQRGRRAPTQAQRCNRGFAGPPCLLGDPVNAGDTVVQWHWSVAVGGKKEGEGAYTSELLPEP